MNEGIVITVAVTILIALLGAFIVLGRNLQSVDDLKSRSKHLDELPKMTAQMTQQNDVISAATRQLAKLTDRMSAAERLAGERHSQILGELRVLSATKASRNMPAVTSLTVPRPRARSVPEPLEVTDDDDDPTTGEGA